MLICTSWVLMNENFSGAMLIFSNTAFLLMPGLSSAARIFISSLLLKRLVLISWSPIGTQALRNRAIQLTTRILNFLKNNLISSTEDLMFMVCSNITHHQFKKLDPQVQYPINWLINS